MHQLDDECPVERARQRPGVRKAKPGERLTGVSGVPHHEHIVPDHRNPVEPDIEVDTLALIVVLHECEQARAGIEVVLQPARRQYRRERADRQLSVRSGQIGAHDDVATATPCRAPPWRPGWITRPRKISKVPLGASMRRWKLISK